MLDSLQVKDLPPPESHAITDEHAGGWSSTLEPFHNPQSGLEHIDRHVPSPSFIQYTFDICHSECDDPRQMRDGYIFNTFF